MLLCSDEEVLVDDNGAAVLENIINGCVQHQLAWLQLQEAKAVLGVCVESFGKREWLFGRLSEHGLKICKECNDTSTHHRHGSLVPHGDEELEPIFQIVQPRICKRGDDRKFQHYHDDMWETRPGIINQLII